MLTFIRKLIFIPLTYFRLWQQVKHQRKFIKHTLFSDIENFKNNNDGSIDDEDFEKILNYYGLGVPAIVAASLSILRACPLNLKERTAATYLGAMTGLGDDFFDVKGYKQHQLEKLLEPLINSNSDYLPSKTIEIAFLHFYEKVKENTKHHKKIKEHIKKVFDVQLKSQKQTSDTITKEEILDITMEKGGVSLLLYRCLMDDEMDENEKIMLYKLGGLMQLGNDIFDIYKDYKMEIKTLVTTENNIDNIHLLFVQLMRETLELTRKLNYPPKNVNRFVMFIMMGLGRVFVCLEMLKKQQLKTDNVFKIGKYSRKELICDMEKPLNILKGIAFYLRY